jgi:hypothetical protein
MTPLPIIHERLNAADVVPDVWFRCNHVEYPLICYVNTIIGLCLSRRYDAIPVFATRVEKHMAERGEQPSNHVYYSLVREYLSAVSSLETTSP